MSLARDLALARAVRRLEQAAGALAATAATPPHMPQGQPPALCGSEVISGEPRWTLGERPWHGNAPGGGNAALDEQARALLARGDECSARAISFAADRFPDGAIRLAVVRAMLEQQGPPPGDDSARVRASKRPRRSPALAPQRTGASAGAAGVSSNRALKGVPARAEPAIELLSDSSESTDESGPEDSEGAAAAEDVAAGADESARSRVPASQAVVSALGIARSSSDGGPCGRRWPPEPAASATVRRACRVLAAAAGESTILTAWQQACTACTAVRPRAPEFRGVDWAAVRSALTASLDLLREGCLSGTGEPALAPGRAQAAWLTLKSCADSLRESLRAAAARGDRVGAALAVFAAACSLVSWNAPLAPQARAPSPPPQEGAAPASQSASEDEEPSAAPKRAANVAALPSLDPAASVAGRGVPGEGLPPSYEEWLAVALLGSASVPGSRGKLAAGATAGLDLRGLATASRALVLLAPLMAAPVLRANSRILRRTLAKIRAAALGSDAGQRAMECTEAAMQVSLAAAMELDPTGARSEAAAAAAGPTLNLRAPQSRRRAPRPKNPRTKRAKAPAPAAPAVAAADAASSSTPAAKTTSNPEASRPDRLPPVAGAPAAFSLAPHKVASLADAALRGERPPMALLSRRKRA